MNYLTTIDSLLYNTDMFINNLLNVFMYNNGLINEVIDC